MHKLHTYLSITFLLVHIALFAQSTETKSATDCPAWDNKTKTTRSNYLDYVRNNQGKKVNTSAKTENEITEQEKTEKERRENRSLVSNTSTKKHTWFGNKKEQHIPEKENINTVAHTTANNKKIQDRIITTQQTEKATPETISNNEDGENKTLIEENTIEKKKKEGWLKKKVKKVFTRKSNKIAKPNYKSCPDW